ncbi:AAA family ATPase [Actinokineospora sp.]|uniref:AAA family ATPase n=1 Tax=Actinokineospora sp. TaxID=1872133 RepID=UPI003D6A0159
MLLTFRVRNFRSFRDEQEFSLIRSRRIAAHQDTQNTGRIGPSTVAGIYGSNASGKSNILDALATMASMVADSYAKWQPDSLMPHEPFALDPDLAQQNTTFEAEVLMDEVRYQYGFEFNSTRVVREYLYAYPTGRRQTWFEREFDGVEEWYFGKGMTGRNRVIQEITRENSLFLSAAASAKHKQLGSLYALFARNIRMASPENFDERLRFTIAELESQPALAEQLTKLLRASDLGIRDIQVRHRELTPEVREKLRMLTEAMSADLLSDTKYRSDELLEEAFRAVTSSVELSHSGSIGHAPIPLPFSSESLGTRALIALGGPALACLRNAHTMLVDEVDASLHPRLVVELIKLFNSAETNPYGAQLIFTSHDTTLLGNLVGDAAPLERDQIWFVQKDADGASSLYPLTHFKPRRLVRQPQCVITVGVS